MVLDFGSFLCQKQPMGRRNELMEGLSDRQAWPPWPAAATRPSARAAANGNDRTL